VGTNHNGQGRHSLSMSGNNFQGYDYGTGDHFTGSVNGINVSFLPTRRDCIFLSQSKRFMQNKNRVISN
jgi:hypothetical protein